MDTAQSQKRADRATRLRALTLFGFSLGNYFLFYAINILLARTLPIGDFDDYNVAISTVLVLSTLATLGLEKFALRCLPAWREQQDWPRSRGFQRFSLRLILAFSLLLVALLGSLWETTWVFRGNGNHWAIWIIVAFLPMIAMFLYLLEIATAYHAQVRAVALYRLVFPAILLVLNGIVWLLPLRPTGITAALCYAISWATVLAGAAVLVYHLTPRELWNARAIFERRAWLQKSLPLLVYALLMTLLAQSGVIILELLHPNEPVVSIYAIAAQTGTFVVLAATATNRLYLPRISVLLLRHDHPGLIRLARNRLKLFGPLVAIFLVGIVLAGYPILGLFGEAFVAGYPALCVIAVGASISTIFSATPYYLQFIDQNKLVLSWTSAAVIANIVLCFPLGYYFGATGAACAYTFPLVLLYLGMRFHAVGLLRKQFTGEAT